MIIVKIFTVDLILVEFKSKLKQKLCLPFVEMHLLLPKKLSLANFKMAGV